MIIVVQQRLIHTVNQIIIIIKNPKGERKRDADSKKNADSKKDDDSKKSVKNKKDVDNKTEEDSKKNKDDKMNIDGNNNMLHSKLEGINNSKDNLEKT
jgi:hypothetical protein